MKAKWYFCTLLFILGLLAFSEQQAHIPNQEIVVQFTYDEVTIVEAENAIAIVKEQLQSIGVDNIQVRESSDGRLKITYYSSIDVDSIKEILSKNQHFELGYASVDENQNPSQFPSEENTNSYKLNINEIQNSYDVASDLNGYLALNQKSERLLNPVVYIIETEEAEETTSAEKTAFTVQRNIAIAIDNTSCIIPEVRAGPLSSGNS